MGFLDTFNPMNQQEKITKEYELDKLINHKVLFATSRHASSLTEGIIIQISPNKNCVHVYLTEYGLPIKQWYAVDSFIVLDDLGEV